MRSIISISIVTLVAGLCVCLGDGPPLSITRTNESVVLTWPQTDGSWLLVETPGLDYSYTSNGVVYVVSHRRTVIPATSYSTNGTDLFVVLPLDLSTSKFYFLQTNNFPPPPSP